MHNSFEQSDNILDISSGILHLSGSSLVPESIDKDCLQDARVLLQLDRKFIPIMASGTLIIIDQVSIFAFIYLVSTYLFFSYIHFLLAYYR